MAQEKKKATTAGRSRKPREAKPKITEQAAPSTATQKQSDEGGGNSKTAEADNATPQKVADGWEVARVLKVSLPLMHGEDVLTLQRALIAHGYHCGINGASGAFERNTAYAVRCFQAANRLIVDGKAGRYTVAALGGVWKG